MALERVSFRKPVQPLPRLSKKYVPGRHAEDYWRTEEDAIMREHYPTKGALFVLGLLPRRSTSAIYARAKVLGLKGIKGGGPKKRRIVTPEMDAQIREGWMKMTGRQKGEVSDLADRLGVRREWLSARAVALGLTVLRVRKEPKWTAPELALLKTVPLHNPHRAAQIFREHGFSRTATALMIRATREGISRRYKATLSATGAAKILGVDGKTFTLWIVKGIIQAAKREDTQRLPQQGGAPWSIERPYFRQWIIDNIERIDIRKVDKFAFVEILTAEASAA